MQRRSALGRLAAALAGMWFGRVPHLRAEQPLRSEAFCVTAANLAESSGTVTCPVCHTMWDSLSLTPAGVCLRCADADPTIKADSRSHGFWRLSPEEIRGAESEIQRLATELQGMNQRLVELVGRQTVTGGERYDRAVEATRDEWHLMQRELHLLQLLRAASRQFGS